MTTATTSDRLRNWLDQRVSAPQPENVCAEHAERAKLRSTNRSANCAHSARDYTIGERRLLAETDIVPGDMPLLDAIKAAFPEAEVIEARRGRYITSNPRRQPVIDLILPIEQVNPARARDLADAWMERVAICEIDGGLSAEDAERVALKEIQDVLAITASSPYTIGNEQDSGSSTAADRGKRAEPLCHLAGNRNQSVSTVALNERPSRGEI